MEQYKKKLRYWMATPGTYLHKKYAIVSATSITKYFKIGVGLAITVIVNSHASSVIASEARAIQKFMYY